MGHTSTELCGLYPHRKVQISLAHKGTRRGGGGGRCLMWRKATPSYHVPST